MTQFRIICRRASDDFEIYEKIFDTEADLIEYLESELESDAAVAESYSYEVAKSVGWTTIAWRTKVELL